MAACPDATVYVHERGAPHLARPVEADHQRVPAVRADDMERLWGEILPVPADAHPVPGAPPAIPGLTVAGHDVDVTATPGHASHHVSYFLPDARIAFVGDTAGLCRASGRVVLPATPPPDIDLPGLAQEHGQRFSPGIPTCCS